MKHKYVQSRFSEIDAAITKAKSSTASDIELQAYLASYLVVLICGIFEDCVECLVGERAAKAKDQEMEHFVRECVATYFRNPKYEYIARLMGLFSDSYKKSFDKKVDDKARSAIGSIVAHRLSVSHGKTSSVTLGEVEKYYNSSRPIFDIIEEILT